MVALLNSIVGLPQASTIAASVDVLYDFVFWVSLVSLVGITAAMLYCMVRYRRSKSDPEKTPYIEGHTPSELGMSVVLFIIVMVIFYWGWVDYKKILTAPAGAMEINVTARQWAWQFEYTNGRKMLGELVVPAGRPVRLLMSSNDVLHSFFVPNFRVKQDIVPGAYTTLWFEAPEVGEHPVYCAEYCGTAHSKMLATLRVIDADEYAQWQMKWEYGQKLGIGEAEAAEATPADSTAAPAADGAAPAAGEDLATRGKRAFAEKGCNACHSITGESVVGPTVKGLFGSEREFVDGATATADENYLRESIMDPQQHVVKGFQPVMPTFRGTLTDDDTNALIAYIKSLRN